MIVAALASVGVTAVHRSIPHANDWGAWSEVECEEMIVVLRRASCTWLSAVAAGHAKDAVEAQWRYRRAMDQLESHRLVSDERCTFVSYEQFTESEAYRADLFGRFKLPAPVGEWENRNAKYFTG